MQESGDSRNAVNSAKRVRYFMGPKEDVLEFITLSCLDD